MYLTVITLLIAVCNKNLLAFGGGMLTLGGFYFRGIPSVTMVMSHFKTKAWIPELGQGTLKKFPNICIFSKTDATSLYTRSIQKRDFSDIKLFLRYKIRFCVADV